MGGCLSGARSLFECQGGQEISRDTLNPPRNRRSRFSGGERRPLLRGGDSQGQQLRRGQAREAKECKIHSNQGATFLCSLSFKNSVLSALHAVRSTPKNFCALIPTKSKKKFVKICTHKRRVLSWSWLKLLASFCVSPSFHGKQASLAQRVVA